METVLARHTAFGAPLDFRGLGARICTIARRFRRHSDGRWKYSRTNPNRRGGDLRRLRIRQQHPGPGAGDRDFSGRAGDSFHRQSIRGAMIQARLRKTFPAHPDSAGFSLDLEFQAAAGVTVLFGPSGAGKTLTLDSIAGFIRPDEGRILLDDQILFDAAAGVQLPPRKRHCGYVFQNYALFPHMTLRENLEFAAE